MNTERRRLEEARTKEVPWRKWGPYLGWTGIGARVMHLFATSTAEPFLELGKVADLVEVEQPRSGQSASAAPSRGR